MTEQVPEPEPDFEDLEPDEVEVVTKRDVYGSPQETVTTSKEAADWPPLTSMSYGIRQPLT